MAAGVLAVTTAYQLVRSQLQHDTLSIQASFNQIKQDMTSTPTKVGPLVFLAVAPALFL